jgi:hypothetical protein
MINIVQGEQKVRLSKIHSSKVSDKEKIDLLSGKITKSGL